MLPPSPSAITEQLQLENGKITGLIAVRKGVVAHELKVKV